MSTSSVDQNCNNRVVSFFSFPNFEKSKQRAIGPRETTVFLRVKGLLCSKGRGKSGDKERRRQRCAISSDRATQDMAAISQEWPDLSFCEIFSPLRLCTSTTTPCIVNSKCIHNVSSTNTSFVARPLQTTLDKYVSIFRS